MHKHYTPNEMGNYSNNNSTAAHIVAAIRPQYIFLLLFAQLCEI